ncbi:MAG: Do family serine endopeptidase [Bacteroidales bacterium]|nr:Do family serine endopeptidase [Bacteroidales bacterium]
MKGQKIIVPALSALIGGLVALAIAGRTPAQMNHSTVAVSENGTPQRERVYYASTFGSGGAGQTDFTVAAEKTVDAVVHVKTSYTTQGGGYSFGNPFLDFFFGGPQQGSPQPVQTSGSGVILTRDGYIVTNNHVIERGDNIEVVLNDKRSFKAKLVGRDPSTDIALLKVEASDLPFIEFGNSDDLRLGEWVLAIGNPFNLSTTVTAGIISAKARNISIINDRYAIESFIQTDAAVNPGNSGGALVNLKGELVGINTAIASQTGSYSGYSFAVPVSIAKKIVSDLMEFGEVQRAILGVSIVELSEELARERGISAIKGVLVTAVADEGAAHKAGIRAGDVLLSVNGIEVNSVSQLQEQVSKHRPGQKVELIVSRNNERKHFSATLTNLKGGLSLVQPSTALDKLGGTLVDLTDKQKRTLGLRGGVQVAELGEGRLKTSGIRKGFIITRLDRRAVGTLSELRQQLGAADGPMLVEGLYPNGTTAAYALSLGD